MTKCFSLIKTKVPSQVNSTSLRKNLFLESWSLSIPGEDVAFNFYDVI